VDSALVLSLYEQYADDLRSVRDSQLAFYNSYRGLSGVKRLRTIRTPSELLPPRIRRWMVDHIPLPVLIQARRVVKFIIPGGDLDPQSDDVDNEITYLLIRHMRPRVVVEIAPCGGWGTTWILSALRDAGQGHLYSYDLIDDSKRTVPRSLASGRWTFVQGDVRRRIESIPSSIDCLFLDAEHSASFARWYINTLFPRLSPGAVVSVDDIFHPGLGRTTGSGEAQTILRWLAERGIRYFTAAPSVAKSEMDRIVSRKEGLGMKGLIHDSIANPTIYFRVPRSGNSPSFPQRPMGGSQAPVVALARGSSPQE
jgi:predicted O-methyltransferase YrrM